MLTYAVYGSGAVVPPPGAGVVTAIFTFPGSATVEAESGHVICPEFTTVHGAVVPFMVTVESVVNPDPVSVRVAAVLIGPELGLIEASVGVAGLVMFSVTAFETGGVAVGVETVTLAVPALAKSAAGTVAVSEVSLA
jgi:hypothetical protein